MAGLLGQQQRPGLLGGPSWGLSGSGQVMGQTPQYGHPQQGPTSYYGPTMIQPPNWYEPQNYYAESGGEPMTDPFKVFGTMAWLLGGPPGEGGSLPRYEQFTQKKK